MFLLLILVLGTGLILYFTPCLHVKVCCDLIESSTYRNTRSIKEANSVAVGVPAETANNNGTSEPNALFVIRN